MEISSIESLNRLCFLFLVFFSEKVSLYLAKPSLLEHYIRKTKEKYLNTQKLDVAA